MSYNEQNNSKNTQDYIYNYPDFNNSLFYFIKYNIWHFLTIKIFFILMPEMSFQKTFLNLPDKVLE